MLADIGALPDLLSHTGSSSGSYLQSLLSDVTNNSDTMVETRTLRSTDYEEYIVRQKDTGDIIFKAAKCYGFRNLQNLVRKVGRDAGVEVSKGAAGRMTLGNNARRRATKATGSREAEKGYDYVEVMACPAGCVNGGGQLRPEKGNKLGDRWGDRAWVEKVEKAYWHDLPTPSLSPGRAETNRTNKANHLAMEILADLCGADIGDRWVSELSEEGEVKRKALFQTEYHQVESDVLGLAVKW